ncbi:MAG: LacI family DNA-binding transcriptional regulator [Bacteroidales bacterium]|nr:LacI family DNA-binding transcriptional regulator [Bacteroidales bacterium]MDT8432671.1 LacI family DNA-binding transcriptional regulator [Bacteroidales bacterium]
MINKKEVTIYDIAKALNLSASTVSRGLRNHSTIRKETTRRINETARNMGYQQNTFAKNLRKNRSNTLGVILPRLDSGFQSSVVASIEEKVNQKGYNLIIGQSFESVEKEMVNICTMYNNRVDGLLISLARDTRDLNHLAVFLEKGIPVVLFDRVMEDAQCKFTSVVIDNKKAGFDATAHLIEQGCRKVMYIGDNLFCNVYRERFEGYRNALADNGIPVDEELTFIDVLNEETGEHAMEKILKMKRPPDGIFAANDTSAVSVICALKKRGIKVPGDIAVVGFNDVHLSRVIEPGLTTIHYRGREMGEIAAATLIEMLGQDTPVLIKSIVLDHHLVVRASSMHSKS